MIVILVVILDIVGEIDLTNISSLGFVLSVVVFVSFSIFTVLMILDFIYNSLIVKKYFILSVQSS